LSTADIVIAALRTGYERLAELVTNFDDDALAGPSAAAEWDIAPASSSGTRSSRPCSSH
jgi:hypothetical protein